MNIASAHATLAVLSDCGFVVRDPVHRTYVLGPALGRDGRCGHGPASGGGQRGHHHPGGGTPLALQSGNQFGVLLPGEHGIPVRRAHAGMPL
jgi:hypothetical protein